MNASLDIIKKMDKVLLIVPVVLAFFSVPMISSITASAEDPVSRQVLVQIMAYSFGFVFIGLLLILDYKIFMRFEYILYGLAIAIQCTVYIPGLGDERYGSQAWINLGFTTVQPSEIVKVLFVVIMASHLSKRQEKLKTYRGAILSFLYGLPIVGIVTKEDLGAGLVMGFMLVGMIFAAGLRLGIFTRFLVLVCVSIPIVFRLLDDYQKDRLTAFLHPDDLEAEATYQVYQAKVAVGSGGFFGKGFREGTIKASNLLPVQESDFIFPIICEELGFVGGIAVICVYGILLFRIWHTVARANELFGALICVGFMCMFGFQIFENIGMTMGLMPVTGITLPFLSAGGSSVLANMIAIGLILSVNVRDTDRSIYYK